MQHLVAQNAELRAMVESTLQLHTLDAGERDAAVSCAWRKWACS